MQGFTPDDGQTARNPFRQIDYAARIRDAGKTPAHHAPAGAILTPGQPYASPLSPARSFEQPVVRSGAALSPSTGYTNAPGAGSYSYSVSPGAPRSAFSAPPSGASGQAYYASPASAPNRFGAVSPYTAAPAVYSYGSADALSPRDSAHEPSLAERMSSRRQGEQLSFSDFLDPAPSPAPIAPVRETAYAPPVFEAPTVQQTTLPYSNTPLGSEIEAFFRDEGADRFPEEPFSGRQTPGFPPAEPVPSGFGQSVPVSPAFPAEAQTYGTPAGEFPLPAPVPSYLNSVPERPMPVRESSGNPAAAYTPPAPVPSYLNSVPEQPSPVRMPSGNPAEAYPPPAPVPSYMNSVPAPAAARQPDTFPGGVQPAEPSLSPEEPRRRRTRRRPSPEEETVPPPSFTAPAAPAFPFAPEPAPVLRSASAPGFAGPAPSSGLRDPFDPVPEARRRQHRTEPSPSPAPRNWPGPAVVPPSRGASAPPVRGEYPPAPPPRREEPVLPPMEPDPPERRGGSVLRALGIGLAVILGVLFLVTCGRLLKELSGNDTHQPETGGAAVQLLPPGQTYPPTAVPIATVPVTASHSSGGNVSAAEPPSGEESPVRTRRSTYPKNQLCNVVPLVKELRAANPDSVGRLVIPGLLEEKVVQRNNIYYLTHDATGAQSSAGAVFVDETCSYKQPPENLLLRGQSTVEGRVFAPLNYFITGGSGFAYTARTAVLTMPYEEEQYFLFAVVKASTDPASPDYFDYASHPSFATDTDMMTYAASAMARSLYQFGVEVDASDRLLTLATVSGGGDSVVLIYRMAREGEV